MIESQNGTYPVLPTVQSYIQPESDTRILPRHIFTSGTLPGKTVLRVGKSNITIDAKNRKIAVYDENKVQKVLIGFDGSNYGAKFYDSNGNLEINLSGASGKISSADGNTYFDLVNKRIIMNDGSTDRLLLGYHT